MLRLLLLAGPDEPEALHHSAREAGLLLRCAAVDDLPLASDEDAPDLLLCGSTLADSALQPLLARWARTPPVQRPPLARVVAGSALVAPAAAPGLGEVAEAHGIGLLAMDELPRSDLLQQLAPWLKAQAEAVLLSADARPADRLRALRRHTAAVQALARLAPPDLDGPLSVRDLQALFEHSLDMILVTQPDGAVLAANPAACAAFGMTVAQMQRAGRAGMVDVGDPRLLVAIAERAATGSARGELRFIRADGSQFPGAFSAQVYDDGGHGPRSIMVVRDISTARAAEDALRDSEAQFRSLFVHMPAGVVVHGPDGVVIDANPQACSILGLSLEQLCGKAVVDPTWQLLRGDGSPMPVHDYPVVQVMHSGMPLQQLVMGIQRPDRDRPTWGLCHAYPVRGADGALLRTVVSFVDISDRVEAETALRRSEERLQRVLRGSNDAPWDWDLQTGAIFYAERWWQMLGYAPGALPATAELWVTLMHPDDVERVQRRLSRTLREGPDVYEIELRLRARDGRYVPLLSRGFVQRDAQGRAVRISGLNTDLTERRQAEAQRQALEAQLRESQKMESIGTLAGGIAHDFNNILGAMLANVALARDDLLQQPEQALASLDQIERAGQRARSLVQQILSFSRREPHALRVQPVRPVVDEALAMLAATLPARVEVHTTLTEAPLQVACDATQLQQVLLNLCTNAWHALPEGSGRIGISLQALPPQAPGPQAAGAAASAQQAALGWAQLSVCDNGGGMDPATLRRVFEPFFTTKPVGQGTGLGLAVAHGIVAAHGGHMAAHSQPGLGSSFHVYLPLADSPVVTTADSPAPAGATPLSEPAAAPAGDALAAQPGRGETVLYVDDDEVMLHVVERLLQRLGYQPRCFADSRQALAAVRSGALAPALVVTDHNMPGLTGLELVAALRALAPGLPVVLSSGYLSDELQRDARALGVAALVHKQHTVETLGPLVARVMGQVMGAGGLGD